MIKSDFYGNDFVWWVGVVEYRKDPLKIGRVRVRIFGLHPFDDAGKPDKVLVPTEKLPWAQVVMSTHGTKVISGPKEGDWVFGFFQDGRSAQIPVIIGTYSGIESSESVNIVYTDVPNPPENITVVEQNAPTTPRTSRGVIENTLIAKTNQQRSQVCDITQSTRSIIGKAKTAIGTIIENIRSFIRTLLASLGLDPSGVVRTVIRLAKQVMIEVNKLKKFAKFIQDAANAISNVVTKVMDMIGYILGLPLKALRFVLECIGGLTSQLSGQLTSFLNVPGININTIANISVIAGTMSGMSTVLSGGLSQVVSSGTNTIGSAINQTNITDISNSTLNLKNLVNLTFTDLINNTTGNMNSLNGALSTDSSLSSTTMNSILNPSSGSELLAASSEFSTFVQTNYMTQQATTSSFYYNVQNYPGP